MGFIKINDLLENSIFYRNNNFVNNSLIKIYENIKNSGPNKLENKIYFISKLIENGTDNYLIEQYLIDFLDIYGFDKINGFLENLDSISYDLVNTFNCIKIYKNKSLDNQFVHKYINLGFFKKRMFLIKKLEYENINRLLERSNYYNEKLIKTLDLKYYDLIIDKKDFLNNIILKKIDNIDIIKLLENDNIDIGNNKFLEFAWKNRCFLISFYISEKYNLDIVDVIAKNYYHCIWDYRNKVNMMVWNNFLLNRKYNSKENYCLFSNYFNDIMSKVERRRYEIEEKSYLNRQFIYPYLYPFITKWN